MKVASTHFYSAPADVVYAAMTAPDVVVAMYSAMGHSDVRVIEHSERAGITSLRTRRGVVMEVPLFAKRFFDPVNVVDQHDEWDPPMPDGSRWGIWQVSARGVPVTAGGQMRLGPTADGCGTVVEMSGEVTCPMPIVGSRIATLVGDEVERTMHATESFIEGYLRERGLPEHHDPTPHQRAS